MRNPPPITKKDKENIKITRVNAIKNVFWLIGRVFKHSPTYPIYVVIMGLLWGIMSSVNMLYVKALLDALEQGRELGEVMFIILAFGLYLLSFYLLHHWYVDVKQPVLNERLHIKFNSELFQKAVALDLDKYDDPAFYNDFIWSMNQSYQRAVSVLGDTRNLIRCLMASITITTVLFTVDVLVAVVIFSISAIRVVFTLLNNRLNHKYFEELNPLQRKDGYINRVFMLPEYAKDLRVSRVSECIYSELQNNTELKNDLVKRYALRRTLYRFFSGAIPTVGEISIFIIMAYKILVSHTMGIGDLAVAVSSIWRLSWQLRSFIDNLMRYHEHGIYVEKIIRFINCVAQITSGTEPVEKFQSLKIENLSFAYNKKGEEVLALKNVNLQIKRGEKIAIVGYNGAGKTTLTKLIMRLYDPKKGNILYNGKPLPEYKLSELREKCAAVFQDYRIFAATVAENVVGGKTDESNAKKVKEILEQSAFGDKLSNLKDGINTILTREFDDEGTNLSGGEQQKIAIARAFYKDADLIILDEPSSALDPDAEYNLNRAVAEYAKGKTVIFISHRLSTTRHADRIYMFDNGEIVEEGSHEDLIALGGKYAYMFNLQAENYRKTETKEA